MKFESEEERLVAEQALLNYRELKEVMKNAPHGKGMAVMEQAIREKGFEQMQKTLSLLINAREDGQKRAELPAVFVRGQGVFQAADAEFGGNELVVRHAQLGVMDDEHLSILADGQRWIWDQAALCWKKAQWVLDVFHVSEHIHDCGKILFGESSPQHQPWAENQTLQLIEPGPVKYVNR